MTTINGFVVSLYDANDGDACAWKGSDTRSSNTRGSSMGAVVEKNYSGYALTKTITATEGFSETTYPAVYYAVNIALSAPSNSTGWFVPSKTLLTSAYENTTVAKSLASISEDYCVGGYYWNASGKKTTCLNAELSGSESLTTYRVRPILAF